MKVKHAEPVVQYNEPMRIGERIRELRKHYKYTQEVLGEKCGVKKSSVSMWENGDTKNIKIDNIIGLAKAFNMSIDELLIDKSLPKEINEAPAEYATMPEETAFLSLLHQIPKKQHETLNRIMVGMIANNHTTILINDIVSKIFFTMKETGENFSDETVYEIASAILKHHQQHIPTQDDVNQWLQNTG